MIDGAQHLGVRLHGERLPGGLDECIDVERILRDPVGVLVEPPLRGEDAGESRRGG